MKTKLSLFIVALLIINGLYVSAEEIIFDENVSESGYLGYKIVDKNGYEVKPEYDDILFYANLPEKYMTENLPPVRDQGDAGTCWAHAFIGAMEISLAKQGLVDAKTVDLSEAHLAYFGLSDYDDIYKDGSKMGTLLYDNGGNKFYALSAIKKGSGAVSESVAPYDEYALGRKIIEEEKRFLSEYGIEEMVSLYHLNTNAIKAAILEYGSVVNSFYMNKSKYMGRGLGYYYPYDHSSNHETVIVGWDDTFSKNNFNPNYMPENDGAWIVRNSYGADWNWNGGYFYISYETYQSLYAIKACCEPEYENYYSYTGSTCNNVSDVVEASAVVYTAKNTETLEAINIQTIRPARINISVYLNPSDTPDSGNQVSSYDYETSGIYEKIKLEKPIPLKKGEKFSIVINGIGVANESDTNTKQGECYHYSNGEWKESPDISINAYTNTIKPEVSASVINGEICVESKNNNDATIYIAQYDENEKLIDLAVSSKTKMNNQTKTYKIFSWNTNMQPTIDSPVTGTK